MGKRPGTGFSTLLWLHVVLAFTLLWSACTTLEHVENVDVATLELHLKEDPENLTLKQDLGVAHFLRRQFTEAEQYLSDVYAQTQADPDPKTLFYLGLTLDAQGREAQAAQIYARYLELPKDAPYRKSLEGRFRALNQALLQKEIRQAIQQQTEQGALDTLAVAVLPFRYRGTDPRFAQVGRGLSAMTSTDLAKIDRVKVLERARLQVLLDELALAQTPYVDQASAPRAGRLLGAGRLVEGSYNVSGDRQFTSDVGLLDVATSAWSGFAQAEALNNLFRMQKELVFQLAASLQITLTPVEQEAIAQLPTQNTQAFFAYCLGLEDEDNHRLRPAARHYRDALKQDPNFEEARRRLDAIEAQMAVEALDWSRPVRVAYVLDYGLPIFERETLVEESLLTLTGALGAPLLPGFVQRTPLNQEVGIPELPAVPAPPSNQ